MRRKSATKRKMTKDPVFDSEVVSKFINIVMDSGKKSISEKIVYGALSRVTERSAGGAKGTDAAAFDVRSNNEIGAKALDLFNQVLDAIRPTVEVKSRRVGGSTYQVPIEVAPKRGIDLAMRWLVTYSKLRSEKSMMLRLANEMLDVLAGRGGSIRKRDEVYRVAKANQAFAHYRW